ncbi:hypothetical protein ACET3Z_006005 [Daucus carota]
MSSRGVFGWGQPDLIPLTPVSEVSEPPESPLPFMCENFEDVRGVEEEDEEEEEEREELAPEAVPIWGLFACADWIDWILMLFGGLAAAAHGVAIVMYVHLFGKVLEILVVDDSVGKDELFDKFTTQALHIMYIASGVFVAGWIEVSCWMLTGERQTAIVRSKYVHVLLNQDMSFFDTYGNNGDIVSQVLGDVLIIQSAISEKVGNYIHNMATFFGGLVIGFINCWQISLITLAVGPFIVAVGGISNIFLQKLAENIQDAYAEAASIAEQALSSTRILYAFTNEPLSKYSYANSLQATLRYGILVSLVQGLGLGFTYGLAICLCALQLWVGKFLITSGKASGGEIIAALFSVLLSGLGMNQAATNLYSFEQGRIAAYRLYEMISRSSSSVNQEGHTLASVQGYVEFRNVYFSYPSRPEVPILSGFYLTIPAKKTVAIVGRTGSGKSSLIPILERFYDPTLGEVLLDGENIKSLNLEWLRSQIGLVTQEPALLSSSIRDNISYGRVNATSHQIEEAAKVARLHAFISSLDKGYDTEVGRAGLSLSQEQKVKLSVARAVLLNPSVLLLDDVAGSLNFEIGTSVQDAIDAITLGRSTLIITQRLSLIKNSDYIAVMEDGQLVEVGTHDELSSLNGLYSELLRYEEALKLPERLLDRNQKEITVHMNNDLSSSYSCQESSLPNLLKSSSLGDGNDVVVIQPDDMTYGSQRALISHSTDSEKTPDECLPPDAVDNILFIKSQEGFEIKLPQLSILDGTAEGKQTSDAKDPKSTVSLLLTRDPKIETCNLKSSNPTSQMVDACREEGPNKASQRLPSFWRLVKLSLAEWLYAVLGSIGAAIFGACNPLLAFVISLIVTAYYRDDGHHLRYEVNKWCLIITGIGVVTVVANFLQHFYFGIMGEKITERVRRMMFSGMLRNEVGWFDKEENSVDILSMRLANDATFVRAAFSNRLSVIVQDGTAVVVAILIGMLLGWQLAFVALATLPVLIVSGIAQKMWLSGFSRGIQELHRKASLVLEDAVTNMYAVVAFCAGNKVLELYGLQLKKIFRQNMLHGMTIGFAFGFSQFLLFACNAFLLWYTAITVKNGYIDLQAALKEYVVFSFITFALVEPFGLAPYIFKHRKSLSSVFEIIDRVPEIDPDDSAALKPCNVYGNIEFKNVDFCYPSAPKVMILNNFSLKVSGGQTVAVVGVSGSGKSTIISLLERFYDPSAGQISLDGRDLKLFNLRWLRNHVGLLHQEPVIFSASVRENIIYARHNATEAELKEAARISNAHHFISSLPHGYDTHLGIGGVELTPGQKQRIAIARVVLKNAPILLLDEATSTIESESSRAVQEALDTLVMGNKTTILIAHRASMMRHVDNVVVINGGQIVEQGSHDSLIQTKGLYAKLMQPQFLKNHRQRWLGS